MPFLPVGVMLLLWADVFASSCHSVFHGRLVRKPEGPFSRVFLARQDRLLGRLARGVPFYADEVFPRVQVVRAGVRSHIPHHSDHHVCRSRARL